MDANELYQKILKLEAELPRDEWHQFLKQLAIAVAGEGDLAAQATPPPLPGSPDPGR